MAGTREEQMANRSGTVPGYRGTPAGTTSTTSAPSATDVDSGHTYYGSDGTVVKSAADTTPHFNKKSNAGTYIVIAGIGLLLFAVFSGNKSKRKRK